MESNNYPKISRENNFDVVRLFAALQVCIGHIFTHFNIRGGGLSEFLSNFPGVTIFFAISGFLISCSWCHSKTIKQYARNRFLRIFPALFVCFIVLQLAIAILGHYNWSSLKDPQMWVYWIGQLTLGQFFTPDTLRDFGVGAPNGSLWTIPIEIEFYLIIPAVFMLLPRINVRNKIIVLAVISLLINIGLALYAPTHGRTNASELLTTDHQTLIFKLIGVTVVPYLYCFLIGSLIYLYWEKIKNLFINKALYWLIGYLVYVYSTGFAPSHSINAFGIFFSNIILCCLAISAAFSFGSLYKFLYGVDISYGIYIIHMIIVNIMIELGYGYNLNHALIALSSTIILSFLMYKYIEKPALALKYNSKITRNNP